MTNAQTGGGDGAAPVVGALRVWWVPQVPMAPFYVPVASVADGVRIMDILADYDAFQFEHRVKPDYANVGGIEVFAQSPTDGSVDWESWYDEETGEDDPAAWLAAQEADGRFDAGDRVRFKDKWRIDGSRLIGATQDGEIARVIHEWPGFGEVVTVLWDNGISSHVHIGYLTHIKDGDA